MIKRLSLVTFYFYFYFILFGLIIFLCFVGYDIIYMDNINVPNCTKDNTMASSPSPPQDCELAPLGIEGSKSKRKLRRSLSKV